MTKNIKKIRSLSIANFVLAIVSFIVIIIYMKEIIEKAVINPGAGSIKGIIVLLAIIWILSIAKIGVWIAELVLGILLLSDKTIPNEHKGLSIGLGVCAIIPFTGGIVTIILSSILLKKTNLETEVKEVN